ncbi:hypothetical protein DRN84_03130 [Candidatus Geothermarchaeota archaeon]|nr:MAG: hypothetical protein DRN84_03130 [Candidatus Geothermarchaeota archaeon]HEW94070.1 phosphate uptake regulator PhoU [Thermoprotei archaeon]
MYRLEVRKVQKLGYSTIVVSLPRNWVKEKNLKKGDSVIVRVEDDGSLRIIPYNLGEEKKITEKYVVDVSKITSKGLVERVLIGNYLLGHDTITFRTDEKRLPSWVVDEITRGISRLAGIEIVDQKLNEITIQCFIDPTKFKLSGLVRRMYTLIFSMLEGIRIYLTEGDKTVFSQVHGMEIEADRLYWLIVRQLLLAQRSWRVAKEIGIEHPYHIVGNRAIIKSLEEIADRVYDIAVELENMDIEKLKISQELLERVDNLLDITDKLVGDSMQAYIELNIVRANDVINEIELFKEELRQEDIWMVGNIKDKDLLGSLRLVLSYIFRIVDSVEAIAEVTINRSLETPSKFVKWISEGQARSELA